MAFWIGDINIKNAAKQNTPGWARTSNLWLRKPALYPIELRGLISLIPEQVSLFSLGLRVDWSQSCL